MNHYTGSYRSGGCYQPDVCGAYVTIQGPRGEKDDTGERGEQGIPGEKGETGETPAITVAPKDAAAPVLTDMRRTSIYNASTTETYTANNTTVSSRTVLDDIVYTNSQETHSMLIRQQDPVTKLWSLCEIHSFLSAAGARVSVRIQWSEYDVTYDAPTI